MFEVIPPVGFFLRNGQVHCWDFCQIPEGFVILFKEQAMSSYSVTLNQLFKLPIKFDINENPALFVLLDQFHNEFKNGTNYSTLTAYLNLVMLKTMELSTTQKNHNPSLLSDFHKFKSLLNENFVELRQVGEYANLMNISTYRLNTVCASAVRKPAMAIIKERVLVEAKNMVAHTSLNVSEIAYNLNFSDTSNFIKFFKSQTSLTPIEYRAKM